MKGNLSSKGSCILRLQGVLADLNTAEKRVADYVLQNAEEVANYTVEDLADKAKSSYATITRLCKRLGYVGFKEFKSNLINDAFWSRGMDNLVYEMSITKGATTETISEKVYTLAMNMLEDSYKIMDASILSLIHI